MTKKGLIFDMDGTMVDNMMVHHRAWQKRLAEAGLELTLEEVMARCHGKNDDILYRLFGDKYSVEERRRISHEKEEIYREVFLPQLKLIAGLPELLDEARSKNIAISMGTAADDHNVNFVLDNLQIRHYFDAIVCANDVTNGKPDPEVFIKAASLMGVEPQNCLVFEDSPTGAKTAQNAQMKAIILTTTHQSHEFENFTSVLKCVPDYRELSLSNFFL